MWRAGPHLPSGVQGSDPSLHSNSSAGVMCRWAGQEGMLQTAAAALNCAQMQPWVRSNNTACVWAQAAVATLGKGASAQQEEKYDVYVDEPTPLKEGGECHCQGWAAAPGWSMQHQ